VWWRDAFQRGVAAAVATSIAGSSGDSASVRLAVSRPPASISVEILAVEANATRRRELAEQADFDVGSVISYRVAVTSVNVLTSNADRGLAAVMRSLDTDTSAVASFTTSLVAGVNAALLLEHISQASFIAGIALLPLPADAAVDTATPAHVLAAAGGAAFTSEVIYSVSSLGAPAGLSELLTEANINSALVGRADGASPSWPPPTLGLLYVTPPPDPPPAPEVEGVGATTVLGVALWCVVAQRSHALFASFTSNPRVVCDSALSCVALGAREIKRRRIRKSHRVYVEDAKAKDDATREAESDADRARREEMARIEQEVRWSTITKEYMAPILHPT
jgi:hypothetical protein